MPIRPGGVPRLLLLVCGACACFSLAIDGQTPATVKFAFFNIQAGKGEQAVPGHHGPFTENRTKGMGLNVWGPLVRFASSGR